MFFKPRLPPEALGRLHRRQSERLSTRLPLSQVFAEANRIHREAKCTAAVDHVNMALNKEISQSEIRYKSTKQRDWARKIQLEFDKRNPFTDINIRGDERHSVILANLSNDTTNEDLQTFADQFGRVVQTRVIRNIYTQTSRRYGFVEYNLEAEARRAISYSRKKRLKGKKVIIDAVKGKNFAGFVPKRFLAAAQYNEQLRKELKLSCDFEKTKTNFAIDEITANILPATTKQTEPTTQIQENEAEIQFVSLHNEKEISKSDNATVNVNDSDDDNNDQD